MASKINCFYGCTKLLPVNFSLKKINIKNFSRILESPDFGYNLLRNFRLFVCGSAPLFSDTFSKFRDRAGMTILERYGMTEGIF